MEMKAARGVELPRVVLGLREALAVVAMVAAAVAAFTSVQVELAGNARRIAVLETSEVPRAEQDARDAERRKREAEWSQRLDRIEGKLDALLLSRRK
jgi:hypothetical protein